MIGRLLLALGGFVLEVACVVWTDPNEDAWTVLIFYGVLLVPAVLFLRLAFLSRSSA